MIFCIKVGEILYQTYFVSFYNERYSLSFEILFRFINRNSILKQNFSLKKNNFFKKELRDVVDYITGLKNFNYVIEKHLSFI